MELMDTYNPTVQQLRSKNKQLRQRVAELEKERSDMMQSIHDQADRYDELSQELELSDALQRDKVDKLTAERDKALQYWQIAEGRCDALMKQRDELLAALEKLSEVYDAMGAPRGTSRIIAEAAIASVKEKQNAAD